jgi:fucose 4-O-acetylase-like acetyltransferase
VSVAAIVDARLATGSQEGIAQEVVGIAAGALLILAVISGLVGIFSRRWRRTGLRIAGLTVAGVVTVYAVGRGVAEFWTVNYSDPSSYKLSWGGPSLAGVFAVHSGPGFVIVIAAAWWLIRRARNRRKTAGREEPSYARTA